MSDLVRMNDAAEQVLREGEALGISRSGLLEAMLAGALVGLDRRHVDYVFTEILPALKSAYLDEARPDTTSKEGLDG